MTEHVGPDGTRYKIIRNPLPDPQDYGHVEPVTDETRLTSDEVEYFRYEATRLLKADRRLVDAGENAVGESVLALAADWVALRDRAEAAEKRVAALEEVRPLPPSVDAFTTCRHPDQGVPP